MKERAEEKDDGHVTPLGHLMNALPIDPHLTGLVYYGMNFGVFNECVALAALHSVDSVFKQDFKQELDRYQAKLMLSDGTFSDSIAAFNALEVCWE